MLLLLIVVLLLSSLVGGGVFYSRFGYAGMSPAGIILLLLVVLYFTGNLHLHD